MPERIHAEVQRSGREADEASRRRSGAAPQPGTPAARVLALQSVAGNRAARRLLGGTAEAAQRAPLVQRAAVSQDAIDAWVAEHGHGHLLAGFTKGMDETAIVGKLIDNFFSRTDFDYNFSATSPFTGKGDCSVLVREFVTIARDVFGIKNIKSKTEDAGYFIPGGGKIVHSANVTGNIDNGAHWYFESHTWAEWDGKPIDVLFGQLGVVSHMAGVQGDYDPSTGSVAYPAGSITFYVKSPQQGLFDRYTTDPAQMLRMGGRK